MSLTRIRSTLVALWFVFAAGAALADTGTETAAPAGETTIAQLAEPIVLCANTLPAGPGQFKAPSSGPKKLIPHGGCCGPVNGGCVSYCNKAGGCTGNADCDVNRR